MRTVQFTVEGHGSFPLDMLRYDACWPRGNEDVGEIHESLDLGTGSPVFHRIDLVSANPTGPTVERWESFEWKVTKVAGKPR